MIIVKLTGGIGNQMFQYAFARSLSIKYKTPLKLELSFFLDRISRANFTVRDYDLDTFVLKAQPTTQNDLNLFNHTPQGIVQKVYYKIIRKLRNPLQIVEASFNFNEISTANSKNLYLQGYWQSEKYFKEYTSQIIADFSFKKPANDYYSIILEQVKVTNSVAVHFRRGDYVKNPIANQYHGLCSIDYYKKAMDYFQERLGDVYFYMISDDIEWAKKHFSGNKNYIYVENNKGEVYEDLRLMSKCKHNIIANSSFSWWGAWLNNNPDKIVIAPTRWFADEKMQAQTQDLIPDTWIQM